MCKVFVTTAIKFYSGLRIKELSEREVRENEVFPMMEAHWIEWIILETATGYQKKELKPEEKPEAEFAVTEPVVAAYEYCNLHGQ